ncbi:MAG: biosynthetic-type acetolactate synthase large subunit [Xylanivirga thermophila]|jgi:acetolactate synthase I/II/III large subunit|uniref:biosynthetic-type acetolactate synthase large subunit n=1 Tax=Xylanivirga thermophila TaxID=2496273 RepID=UPI0039F52AF3
MKMTGAQAVVKALELEGIEVVFGYPGGAVLPIYDALKSSSIRNILVRHEQAAAHAASGYARASGRVGVCMATSGPGATNIITGIATAYMDSIPIVVITGQVPTSMIGRDVFQEVDITGATAPFTKHNYLVKHVQDIPRIMKEAFYIASTGRQGPVLIDIPNDIAKQTLKFEYSEEVHLRGYKPNYSGHPLQIKRAAAVIKQSKRPTICVGGGVISSNSAELVLRLAQRINAPVVNTLMGIGAFPASHGLSMGMIGQYGIEAANEAVAGADVLIVLGARMGDRAIGSRKKFVQESHVIHIDIDPAEIGKNIDVDTPIVGDIAVTLRELLKLDISRDGLDWINILKDKQSICRYTNSQTSPLDPVYIIKALSASVRSDTIVVTDVGQHQIWTGRYFKIQKPRTFLTSGGLGTMGYGLPAAIGAKIACPKKPVMLISGDGGFQMSMAELSTVVNQGLPLKMIILDNERLGMVRELQQHYYGGRYFGIDMGGNPDFITIAKAYGIRGIQIEEASQVMEAVDYIINTKEAILARFVIDPDANVIPFNGEGKDETYIGCTG